MRLIKTSLLAMALTACSSYSHTNLASQKLADIKPGQTCRIGTAPQASRSLDRRRGAEDVLVILTASGGGSRAAYFAGSAMLALDQLDVGERSLLEEVDVMSSVSGGSLAASYYAASHSDTDHPLVWAEGQVKDRLAESYLSQWIASWFLPSNFLRFWFTSYDRTDIMADTINERLFLDGEAGHVTFAALNPDRPNLILNSTRVDRQGFARRFTFTNEDFTEICSDLDTYSLPRAVMATATFPGVFNVMTLQDYRHTAEVSADRSEQPRFLHLVDGGLLGNLGLDVPLEELGSSDVLDRYRHVIVISLNAAVVKEGLRDDDPDPRMLLDYVVDSNVRSAINASLNRIDAQSLSEMRALQQEHPDKVTFWHLPLRFKDQPGTLRDVVSRLKTSFLVGKTESDVRRARGAVDGTVEVLTDDSESCVQRIREVFAGATRLSECVSREQSLL